MSDKQYLSGKNCACCTLGLSKSRKSDIRVVSSQSLLEKLNTARRTILEKKNKPWDDKVVQCGDLVCKRCITFAYGFKTLTSTRQRKSRQLSVHRFFRDYSQGSTSRESSSSEDNTYEEQPEIVIDKIMVEIPRTTASHSHCVVCSRGTNLTIVPNEAFLDAFIKNNILIPMDCRCCREHLTSDKTLTNESVANLTAISNNTKLTGYEVKMLLDNLRHSAKIGLFNKFAKSSTITEEECFRYTGLTKERFGSLRNDLVSLRNSPERKKSQVLPTYLFWMKTGLDYRTIASIFSLDEFQTVGHYCKQTRDSLLKNFVPKYLGANHLQRDEWLKHNSDIVKELITDNDNQFVIIADGTYCYCQKSNNNYFQRRSYSMQRKRHLVKPFVICSSDGLIVDIYGLFPTIENDATIIQKVLDSDRDLRNLLQAGDHILVDRGFRDAVDKLQTIYRLKTHMPTCVPPNQKQLTTLQANQSRFITKCRWPVEVVNGL